VTTAVSVPPRVEVIGQPGQHADEVLTAHALAFAAGLHRAFNVRRQRLLADRVERQARFATGELPDFLPNTAHVRADREWRVALAPPDLEARIAILHVLLRGK
jgi:malate synthase